MLKPQLSERCTINELNQSTGAAVEVVKDLKCSNPTTFNWRQNRAETAYDFRPMEVYTDVPTQEIKEGMRIVFKDGQDLRIHSINPWPMVKPSFYLMVLQGEGA